MHYVMYNGRDSYMYGVTNKQTFINVRFMSHSCSYNGFITNDSPDGSHTVPEDHSPPSVTATDLPGYCSRSMVERYSLLPSSSAVRS